jgi:hypothetical protein
MLEQIQVYIPFLIPLAIVQLGLMIAAVIHILRHETFRFGNRGLWLAISILLSVIGPVLYFTIGKGDES